MQIDWLAQLDCPHDVLDGGNIVLINGDCLKVLPLMPKGCVDAVVADPPYGIDYSNAGGFCASAGWGQWKGTAAWDKERPPREVFDAMLSLDVPTTIWGGNYFTDYLPPSSKWLVWDKGQTDFSLADVELAWCSFDGAARRMTYPRSLALRDGKEHPTQKPIAVMVWNIERLPRGCDAIADPFIGSGTTGVACVRTGRKFIGIEIDPGYYAIAKRRILNELAQPRLPFAEPVKQEQAEMFGGAA